MAVKKKYYKHSRAGEMAIISNPRSGLSKMVYADEWSLKDWKKIVEFYENHEYFTIWVE